MCKGVSSSGTCTRNCIERCEKEHKRELELLRQDMESLELEAQNKHISLLVKEKKVEPDPDMRAFDQRQISVRHEEADAFFYHMYSFYG